MFQREHLSSFENPPGAVVAAAHLELFVIGHGEDSQRQDFIDLRAVEKIARAFGSDLRIVVKNDGRGKKQISLPFFSSEHESSEHGPGSDVAASGYRGLELIGRIE